MSLNHSPKIVTDGLVLCLDAASRKSYPGSGTTWFDRSGNGNHGTLVNGAAYSSSYTGSIVLDGLNDRVEGNISSSTFLGPHSISCWFYRRSQKQWAGLFSNNVNTYSSSLLTFINNTTFIGVNQAGVNANYVGVDLSSDHFNKWIYCTIVFSGYTSGSLVKVYAYKDNSLLQATGNLYWTLTSSSQYYIGDHYTDGRLMFDGFIPQTLVYNKALTAQEVQQNFSATRGRYGV